MRSRASRDGHPIHPALIPFPLAFLVGAFGFDAAGAVLDNEDLWRTGGYLAIAGIVAAVVAAVPGFIDYLYTVPPNSTGKQRATRHMLVNLSAVALFTSAVVLRGSPQIQPEFPLLLIELIGVGLLAAGGWMGGVLVGRNQISVDHRYAGAGKWKEQTVAARAGEAFEAARADELAVNQMKLLRTPAGRIVLARSEAGWVAFDDRCTHRGGSLAGGAMICGTVQCPWHGSQFDTATGQVRAGPASAAIRTYRTEERDGVVYVTV